MQPNQIISNTINIIDTWDVLSLTGEKLSTPKNLTGSISGTYQTLNLYIPESWYTDQRSSIIQYLRSQSIILNIVAYRWMFFQDTVLDSQDDVMNLLLSNSTIDMIMIDTDHVSLFSGWGQTLQQPSDINTFIHHSLVWITNQYPYFFPWWLDPAVTITDVKNDHAITIEYLNQLSSIQLITSALYIPVLIWDTTDDQSMIQSAIHPLIDNILLKRINDYNNTTPIYTTLTKQLLTPKNKYRSSWYLLKLDAYLYNKNTKCIDLMGLCMLDRGMTSALFGWMSDRRMYQTISDKQLHITQFPHRTTNYPCKWWGIVINKKSTQKKAAITLLTTLIDRINAFDFDLYDTNLSAYNQLLQIQTQWSIYKNRKDAISMCRI